MLNKDSRWMVVSGATAFTFFVISNFTTLFVGSTVIAACLQLTFGTFVFVVWSRTISKSRGIKKLVAIIGTAVPVVMASITVYRVLLPWLSSLLEV